MKNLEKRKEVIKYSIKLNTTNLSPLRSGNISVRSYEDGIQGFLITPSGKKYASLKEEDIVFVSNDGNHDTNLKPCLLYTSPSPRDSLSSRMPSSA